MKRIQPFLVRSFQFLASILLVAVLFDALLGICLYKWYSFFQVPSYETVEVNVPRKNVSNPTQTIQKLDTSAKPVSVKNQSSTSLSSVKDQILAIAKEKNFKWPEYLLKLSYCESGWNPKAVNKNSNGTADKGLFQINDVHKIPDHLRFDIRWATEWTINKVNEGSQGIWVCDRHIKAGKFNNIAVNL